ncbi:2-Hydroxyacid oxidase 1 isoform X1 [Parasteatoda tepidariorum]|uniref:2-Hydroxyacid oxidase 1 isoform X1 n=2 Tax=Parasteatoda tepidariorum TaxID=114398 RepID=UPI001C7256C1|nr:hydroxyacid oxidase 1 isoform X1 [Parasteatoda tepidariorum]
MATSNSIDDFFCIDDFEKFALKSLSKKIGDYYKSGANNEQTLIENKEAFKRLRFRTRSLQNVSKRHLAVTLAGKDVSFPIGIAPTAMQRMAHPDGEIATIKGANHENVIMILSTLSTTSMEDVAKAAPNSKRWFQLYIYNERKVTENLVARAEKAGFSALVVTVDTPVFGHRIADSRNRFALPPHLRLANFDTDLSSLPSSTEESNLNKYVNSLFDPSLTWEDILWLKSITSLPIIVKGVLTAEDAISAVKYGVSGIIVSNHGGRQLDGVPATIEALPEVVRAVAGRCEVYMDGGVRTGTDVLKALILGAKAVFIGRPILWGLAHSGEKGVIKVLQILKKELDLSMALLGCTNVNDLKPSMVVRQEHYSKL